jgi:microcystin-dependent protein
MSINRNLAAMAGNVDSTGVVSGAAGGTITGEVKMWATATAPTGYLLCDGSVVSRTTYAALFAVIGTTFGAGDGSTTFKLPSFRDRMPIGAGASYSANTTGGSTDAVVVSHTHSATPSLSASHALTFTGDALGGHSHGIPTGAGGGSASISTIGAANPPNYTSLVSNSISAGTPSGTIGGSISISGSITNASTGVSATNANLPPYIGIHFIIRT